MADKNNHTDFLSEQEDKKNQTLQELKELRSLLGKDTVPTAPEAEPEVTAPEELTPEEPTPVDEPTQKPEPQNLDDTQVLSAAAKGEPTEPVTQNTVLIESDIYRKAQAEQARKEEQERQERIRRTSPKKKKTSAKKTKEKSEPTPIAGEGGTGAPKRRITREEARKRRKARVQRRMILTGVVTVILLIVIAAAIHTIVTARNSRQLMGSAGSAAAMENQETQSGVVTTETGAQIAWDDSKPASEQITEQYLAIKDDADAAEYQKKYPGLYAESRSVPTVESESKVCYLTFDDGPSDTVTPKILDTLEQYDVKATFFLVASQIEGNEALVKRMIEDGNTVCIHANVHEYDTIYASIDAYLDDFAKAYDTIYETTGYRVQGFRFPGGSNNGIITSDDTLYQQITNEMIRRGFEYYDWNAYDGDAEGAIPEPASLASRAIEEVEESSRNDVIVLMHDTYGKENTAAALPSIIEGMRNNGIEMLPITSSTRPVHFYVSDDYTPSEYSLEAEESSESTDSGDDTE